MKYAPPPKSSSQAPPATGRLTHPPGDAPVEQDPADGPTGELAHTAGATQNLGSKDGSAYTIDDDRLRAILRGSAAHRAPPDLLGGVQRRIWERSRGRFYGDGWSRSKATTSSYIVTSILVLGIFLLAYYVLIPSLPVK